MRFLAVFGLSLGGFLLTHGEMGESTLGGLIHYTCIMGFTITGLFLLCALLAELMQVFGEHTADRTQHFCPRCGEELFPPAGLWSKCSYWKCGNCGAESDYSAVSISISPYCREATRKAVVSEVEKLRRGWKDTAKRAATSASRNPQSGQ